MTTFLGIDYGEKKIGLSLAQKGSRLALPLNVIRFNDFSEAIKNIQDIVREEKVDALVVGVPFAMGSSFKNDQVKKVRMFIKKLKEQVLDCVFEMDERLTTQEARKLLCGYSKGDEDAVAAMIILQTYLDLQK